MCARVARTCGGRRLKSTEAERKSGGGGAGMKERGGEEWERPPLAVPPDWFELGTPAGIQARTSCRGVWVCVCAHAKRWEGRRTDKSKREGWTETKRRSPATCRQFLIRLWCALHNEDQMHKKKRSPAAYFFLLLRKWDCSCLRPADDLGRTRCSGDASQWGQKQTDENRFSCLIWEFTFPVVFQQLWAGAADP